MPIMTADVVAQDVKCNAAAPSKGKNAGAVLLRPNYMAKSM